MSKKDEELRYATLTQGCIDEKTYEVDDSFREGANTFNGVHTVTEIVRLLESDPNIGFDGLFIAGKKDGKGHGAVRLNREKFLEKWKQNTGKRFPKKMLENWFDGGGAQYGQLGANEIVREIEQSDAYGFGDEI